VVAQERAKLFRRLEAIGRLHAIAHETNDLTLQKEADRLEQRAWAVCEQRTAQARMNDLLPLDDKTSSRRLVAPEPRLDRGQVDRPLRSIVARNPGTPIPEED
jgi:hypothetical protein